MKKHLFLILFLFLSFFSFAQLPDPPDPQPRNPVVGEQGGLIAELFVTITIDFQPMLQLQMTTPNQMEFIFDDIRAYYAGITKYAATVLKVSSSVQWDLYAVATSQNGSYWDTQFTYSKTEGSAVSELPLSLLELYQHQSNEYTEGIDCDDPPPWCDYSLPFLPPGATEPGRNSIYYNSSPYIAPDANGKYIYGHKGTDSGLGVPGGSYLITEFVDGLSDYYFTIDYRILPGLPPVFPAAGDNDGTPRGLTDGQHATPGVYTANVKFILLEDQ